MMGVASPGHNPHGYAVDPTTGAPVDACTLVDPEVMFPPSELPDNAPEVYAARKVCDSCFFRTQCANEALTRREQYGVWGGLSEKQRAAMFRQRNRVLRAAADTGELFVLPTAM